MRLNNSTADCFVPDRQPQPEALRRITHLGIGAHPDDLEFMAFHGIFTCFSHPDQWFGGVTFTHGSGSARTGRYADCTNPEMMAIRRTEQNTAAVVGGYGAMIQLDYASSTVKSPTATGLTEDLREILEATRPSEQRWFVLADIPAGTVNRRQEVEPGCRWHFSFSRCDYTRGIAEPVISSTSPHPKPDFHSQSEWGVMEFQAR